MHQAKLEPLHDPWYSRAVLGNPAAAPLALPLHNAHVLRKTPGIGREVRKKMCLDTTGGHF